MRVALEPVNIPPIDPWSPIYSAIVSTFDMRLFTSPRLPIDLGPRNLATLGGCQNVLQLPIKAPGSLWLEIPDSIAGAAGLICDLMRYESAINPLLSSAHAHVTIDWADVQPGDHHRREGFHIDGFLGAKYRVARNEHSYIGVIGQPTEVCLQPFFVSHLDTARSNVFLEFDKQAKPENVYETLPGHVYLIDPYIVHRTPKIRSAHRRLFFRLTVGYVDFNNHLRTQNPAISTPSLDGYVDMREWVVEPDVEVPYRSLGIVPKLGSN